MKKKILIVLFIIVICFATIGCGEYKTPSNDALNSKEENNNSSLDVGKYKVEKENNSILIITNNGSAISTTTYYFTNNKVSSAKLVEEFFSKTIAETSYNTMKNESAIMNQYSDIKLDGKKVILTIKSEILSAYSSFGYEEFYNLMYDTYKVYMD